MKIEVLFPELCNLYGDNGNIQYLAASMPEAELVRTGNLETPRFTKEPVDLIYLGSMSESHQELAIRRLLPHAGVLRQYVESGGVLLATGNALELFGTYIQEGKRQIPALGLFPCHAVRDMEHRHNSMFLGTFGDMKIVGARSQFSFSYGDFPHPFLQVTGGYGIYPEARVEGIHYKNFFATYLLGPFLVLNPRYTQYLLQLLGCETPPAFWKEAMEAYEYRLRGLETPGVCFLVGEHG